MEHIRLAAIIAAHETASGVAIPYRDAIGLATDYAISLDELRHDVDAISDTFSPDPDLISDIGGEPVTQFGRLLGEISRGYSGLGNGDIDDIYMAELGAPMGSALGAWLDLLGDHYLND